MRSLTTKRIRRIFSETKKSLHEVLSWLAAPGSKVCVPFGRAFEAPDSHFLTRLTPQRPRPFGLSKALKRFLQRPGAPLALALGH